MSGAEIEKRIREYLKKVSKSKKHEMLLSSKLQEDLGLDSLDLVELLFEAENTFDIEIPNEDAKKFVTVGDAVAYVVDKTNVRTQNVIKPNA